MVRNTKALSLVAVLALAQTVPTNANYGKRAFAASKAVLVDGAIVAAGKLASTALFNNIDPHEAEGIPLGELAKQAPLMTQDEFAAYIKGARLKKRLQDSQTIQGQALQLIGHKGFKENALLCDLNSGLPLRHKDGALVQIPFLQVPNNTVADWAVGDKNKKYISVAQLAVIAGHSYYEYSHVAPANHGHAAVGGAPIAHVPANRRARALSHEIREVAPLAALAAQRVVVDININTPHQPHQPVMLPAAGIDVSGSGFRSVSDPRQPLKRQKRGHRAEAESSSASLSPESPASPGLGSAAFSPDRSLSRSASHEALPDTHSKLQSAGVRPALPATPAPSLANTPHAVAPSALLESAVPLPPPASALAATAAQMQTPAGVADSSATGQG